MKKAKNKRVFFIVIRGEKWRYRKTTLKTFLKRHPEFEVDGDDNWATSDPDAKTIDFITGKIDRKTVRHELWHVYNYTLHLTSAGMTIAAVEEVQADMVGECLDDIYNQAEEIYSNLIEA